MEAVVGAIAEVLMFRNSAPSLALALEWLVSDVLSLSQIGIRKGIPP
jgi:hypothetical protein